MAIDQPRVDPGQRIVGWNVDLAVGVHLRRPNDPVAGAREAGGGPSRSTAIDRRTASTDSPTSAAAASKRGFGDRARLVVHVACALEITGTAQNPGYDLPVERCLIRHRPKFIGRRSAARQ